MKLTTLELEHFRNIRKATLEFPAGINVFIGKNGQGKTNLLEAIFALSLSRPFRSRDKEVFIEHEQQYARVRGEVEIGRAKKECLEIFWDQMGKQGNGTVFRKNGTVMTSKEFLRDKHFFAVLFTPEDLELVFAAPQKRRQFLSRVLSPLSPEFLSASLNFEKVLRHRNKLLAEFPQGKVKKMEFDFWDTELAKWGEIIQKQRRRFLEFGNQHIVAKYRLISRKTAEISLEYRSSISEQEDFFTVLAKHFRHDVRYGFTQKGPHRDDFQMFLRGKPLSETASRGEIRSAMIALKLCERDFIAEETSLSPVLILDDVFSELDEVRRTALLESFASDQVFISSTELPKVPKKKGLRVFEVEDGEMVER